MKPKSYYQGEIWSTFEKKHRREKLGGALKTKPIAVFQGWSSGQNN